jgi:hypothetical protein
LIPEPDKNGNVVENGVKADKHEGSNSSIDKSNLSASEQPKILTPAKKGKEITLILFSKKKSFLQKVMINFQWICDLQFFVYLLYDNMSME